MSKPYGAYERALRSCEKSRREAQKRAEMSAGPKAALVPVDKAAAMIGDDAMLKAAFITDLLDTGNVLDLPAGTRRITDPNTRRDLSPLIQERMQEVCYFLVVTTPFGKRIVEIISSYVVGEGFRIAAEDAAVQDVIDRFADDPVNNLAANLRAWTDECSIFGELCLPVAVNPVDGFVRLGYIDPMDIQAVEFGGLQTGDGKQEISIPVAVRLKQRLGDSEGRRLEIVRRDEQFDSESFGQLTGDVFYLAINKAKAASRGISELFNIADWLDVLDQIVFDGADRARFMNAWLWHFIVKGGDDKAVEKVKEYVMRRRLTQGGAQFTNDQVEIRPLSPDLKSYEYGEIITNLKAYGLGGVGFPMHWFADPVDANRATAAEMGDPTIKKLTDRQRSMRLFTATIIDFVLDQAVAHGVLPESVNRSYKVETPEVSTKDLAKVVGTMQTGANALALMEDRGWILPETAARGSHLLLTQIGLEVDSQEEFRQAQEQKKLRDAEEINRLKDQSDLAAELERSRMQTEVMQ